MVGRYFTGRCIRMHMTLLVLLPAFGVLTWWQLNRAESGNTLSWAYTFEWPLFAGYACYMWWHLIHDTPESRQLRTESGEIVAGGESGAVEAPVGWALGKPRHAEPVVTEPFADAAEAGVDDDTEDEALAAYNRYLAELNVSGGQKTW